jgi:2,4-dienoyl-CoA reductase-like NADH-dependent reductase (Old Yellow Enzyme family)
MFESIQEFYSSLSVEMQTEIVSQITTLIDQAVTFVLGLGAVWTGYSVYIKGRFSKIKKDLLASGVAKDEQQATVKAVQSVAIEAIEDAKKVAAESQAEMAELKNMFLMNQELITKLIAGTPIDQKTLVEAGQLLEKSLGITGGLAESAQEVLEQKLQQTETTTNYIDTLEE